MYTSYEYYQDTYCGGLDEMSYNRSAARAEAIIRYLTYTKGNIFQDIEETNIDSLKMACCAAADTVAAGTSTTDAGAETARGTIKSENTDGYSVTYAVAESASNESAEAALRRRVYEAIKVYLMPTGWLYLGTKVRWRGYDHKYESNCL